MLSFSTMWAQQPRFEDMARFRAQVAKFGYDAIEASHSTPPAGLKTLLGDGEVPLSSLHAPTPYRRLPDGRANGDANLASLVEAQRQRAVAETKRSIDYAALGGLRYVVVHLGGVGDAPTDEEHAVRRLFEAGETQGAAWDAARETLRRYRAQRAPAHLVQAQRSLRELVQYAAPHRVAIGIESRLNYHEIPHPREAVELLAPYDNDVAGFWYDVGHCEVQHRLGMIDHESWYPAIESRIIGAHLHDVTGILDHRAPGNGTLDWAMIAEHLPETALRVLEINQHEPDAITGAAGAFLRDRGVV
jgi:sugar phosphate isomerase/epimerase